MIATTNAICLSSIRYADTSLIIKVYSKDLGLITLIAKGVFSGKSKKKVAFFHPFAILELTINYHPEKKIQQLKEVSTNIPQFNIIESIEKSSIAIFLCEVISKSINHEDKDEKIYELIEHFAITLNEIKHPGNIHLSFLIEFTRFLGISPRINRTDSAIYFDLLKGEYIEYRSLTTASVEVSELLFKFINCSIAERILYPLSREGKNIIIENMLDYYQLHLSHFKNLKSLEILQEVFHT